MSDENRRNQPLLPMRIVTELTELTPRQNRYYETCGLIQPDRTQGKQRLFSFYQVDLLLKIKAWKEKGVNLAGIKELLFRKEPRQSQSKDKELSDRELYKLLKRDLIHRERPSKVPLNYGDFSRFFHH